ncbi:hypothetical protein E5288_WYG001735 [Bos mutus]|uniref:Uncharacterized protein n=1 Tax=Bos mutus TaxID=72004 RepID=A0A6B0RPQ7_9CETA|nr:hypothetical protein [Bos mutus]
MKLKILRPLTGVRPMEHRSWEPSPQGGLQFSQSEAHQVSGFFNLPFSIKEQVVRIDFTKRNGDNRENWKSLKIGIEDSEVLFKVVWSFR